MTIVFAVAEFLINLNSMLTIVCAVYIDIVLDDLVATRQLDFGLRPRVRDIMLKKHRHLHERRKSTQKKKTGLPSLRGTRKNSSAPNNMDKGKTAD